MHQSKDRFLGNIRVEDLKERGRKWEKRRTLDHVLESSTLEKIQNFSHVIEPRRIVTQRDLTWVKKKVHLEIIG
jgi:hypothetical protein